MRFVFALRRITPHFAAVLLFEPCRFLSLLFLCTTLLHRIAIFYSTTLLSIALRCIELFYVVLRYVAFSYQVKFVFFILHCLPAFLWFKSYPRAMISELLSVAWLAPALTYSTWQTAFYAHRNVYTRTLILVGPRSLLSELLSDISGVLPSPLRMDGLGVEKLSHTRNRNRNSDSNSSSDSSNSSATEHTCESNRSNTSLHSPFGHEPHVNQITTQADDIKAAARHLDLNYGLWAALKQV
jgi:hypothetical protein